MDQLPPACLCSCRCKFNATWQYISGTTAVEPPCPTGVHQMLTVGSSSTYPTHISDTSGIITDSSNWSADACNTTLEPMKISNSLIYIKLDIFETHLQRITQTKVDILWNGIVRSSLHSPTWVSHSSSWLQ